MRAVPFESMVSKICYVGLYVLDSFAVYGYYTSCQSLVEEMDFLAVNSFREDISCMRYKL